MSRSITGLVIEPSRGDDGQQCRLVEIPTDERHSLPMLQEIVGGYIDVLHLPQSGDNRLAHMWIHDEGKFVYGADGYNGLATDLMRALLAVGDYITGPVVICGTGKNGYDMSVPGWVVSKVKRFPDSRWSE